MAMRCGSCGREIQGRYDFCPYCGFSITGKIGPSQVQLQNRHGINTTTLVIILIVLFVVIPVVLASILYVMTLGFGGTSAISPTTQLTVSDVPGGVKMTLAQVSIETIWSDVTILISDSANTGSWYNISAAHLDDGLMTTKNYGDTIVGSLAVNLRITDLAGNGYLNQGDYLTLVAETFSETTRYTVTMIYDPTASEMCHTTFSG